jgi:hypothetical protein
MIDDLPPSDDPRSQSEPDEEPSWEDEPRLGFIPRWALRNKFIPDTEEEWQAAEIRPMSRRAAYARIDDVCSEVETLTSVVPTLLPIEGADHRGPTLSGDERRLFLDKVFQRINLPAGDWLALMDALPEEVSIALQSMALTIDDIWERWKREEEAWHQVGKKAAERAHSSGKLPISPDCVVRPERTIYDAELTCLAQMLPLVKRTIEHGVDNTSNDRQFKTIARDIIRELFGVPEHLFVMPRNQGEQSTSTEQESITALVQAELPRRSDEDTEVHRTDQLYSTVPAVEKDKDNVGQSRGRAPSEKRRDGSQTMKVFLYFINYMNFFNDSFESGEPIPPLESQAAIARRLNVSEATVSRVAKGWRKKYRKEIKSGMLAGWKKKDGSMDAFDQ